MSRSDTKRDTLSKGRIIPLRPLDVRVETRRLGAVLLDLLALGILQIWIDDVFGVTRVTSGSPTAGVRSSAGFAYVNVTTATSIGLPWLILLGVAYFSVQEALFGATWGKMVAGLRVVDVEGRRPTPQAVLARNVLRIVDAWPLFSGVGLVGLVAAMTSPRRQRLGDRLARTLVARAESAPLAYLPRDAVRRRLLGLAVALALCAVFCLGFAYYGRPPLVLRSLANTNRLFWTRSPTSYSFGTPRWGAGTVIYPVRYTSIDGRMGCRGAVTLRWAGFFTFDGGWVLQSTTRNRC